MRIRLNKTPTFFKGVVLGAAVAMVTLVGSAAVAGTGVGKVFNLGETNRVNARSQLEGATPSAVLNVTNSDKSASASGVAIDVPAANAPLVVNSSTKVKNFNADLLDGHDASTFQTATSKACANGTAISSIAPNGATSCNASVVLPIDAHQAPGVVGVVTYAPSSLSLTFNCVTSGVEQFFVNNTGAAPAKLTYAINAMGSNPTTTNVEDIQPGGRSGFAIQPFLLAQLIYFDETTVTTINISGDAGADDCEEQGTAAIALR